MYIRLKDGVRLFVDTKGSTLSVCEKNSVIDEQKSILLLHGGPGMDHMVFRPCFDTLADYAHVVYVDQRGCGRSDSGPIESWNLDQWADDVAELIDALGLHKPIVLGTSFGGFVAQRFASRHPETSSGLILMSTAYKTDLDMTLSCIKNKGGSIAHDAARKFFTDANIPGVIENYFESCLSLYTHNDIDDVAIERVTQRVDVMQHFFKKDGMFKKVNLLIDLKKIVVPTLVVHGEQDPIFPMFLAEDMYRVLKNRAESKCLFVPLPDCGHLSEQDSAKEIVTEIISFFEL